MNKVQDFNHFLKTWMKLFIIFAIIVFFTVFENVLEDATYIKAEFYELGRQYNGVLDLLLEWDQRNFFIR